MTNEQLLLLAGTIYIAPHIDPTLSKIFGVVLVVGAFWVRRTA